MSDARPFPVKRFIFFNVMTFIIIGILRYFSGIIVAQTPMLASVIFPLMTVFLVVFHILIAVFMLMKYFCNRQQLYLVPLALAFAGSTFLMSGTLSSYINWLQCDMETVINYNSALTYFSFRNLLMVILFICSIILYAPRRNQKSELRKHHRVFALLIGIVILIQGLAWLSINNHSKYILSLIDETTLSYTLLWRDIVLTVLTGLWVLTLIFMVIKTRMDNLFWFSGYLFCIFYIYTLIIMESSAPMIDISWYQARLFEAAGTLFLIFVLLGDVFSLYHKTNDNYLNSYQNSIRDPLTRLYNRSYFYDSLKQKMSEVSGKNPLSVVICDLDHFKRINDTYGHLEGDQVIQFAASVLQSEIREEDIAARIGGEEFALMLTNTNAETAALVAERIRQAIAERSPEQFPEQITLSMGVYSMSNLVHTPETCVQLADKGLYQAKKQGRNQVVIWEV